jgi:hypothetical protein
MVGLTSAICYFRPCPRLAQADVLGTGEVLPGEADMTRTASLRGTGADICETAPAAVAAKVPAMKQLYKYSMVRPRAGHELLLRFSATQHDAASILHEAFNKCRSHHPNSLP